MTTKIRALGNFMHGYYRGRLDAVAGVTYEVPKTEAAELVKAGLVEIVVEDAPAEPVAEENLDDLVGGDKAAPEVENKMEPAPTNKKAR